MLHNLKRIKGYRLGAKDGEIGKVKDVYFDDQSWTIRYLIADTGNWLPSKMVLISPFAIRGVDESSEVVPVDLTKKQIQDSPAIEVDQPVSRQYEMAYYKYYGWPMYWEGPALWGPTPVPAYYGHGAAPLETRVEKTQEGDPHLRSANEVISYRIEANDGEIGHVEDFLVDDENWTVRYMEIDTRNWWPGKKVLLAPQWIREVSWDRMKVFVDVPREVIRGAPEYDPYAGVTRGYETRLFDYYGKEAYWHGEHAGHHA